MKKVVLLATVALSIIACKEGKKDADTVVEELIEVVEVQEVPKTLTVAMNAKNDSGVAGNVTFSENDGTVTMVVALTGLTEGEHAMHIHENADCSSADGKSAGGHWAGMEAMHGKWGNDKHHSGDIGNLEVGADGVATLEFSTDKWCLGCGDDKKDLNGHGIIVHAAADDFESQPSGAAGARVACGEIKM